MTTTYDWNEELCRRYADGLRPMVRFDHRRWAGRIAAEVRDLTPGATVVDLATGPGFLLVELGKLLPGFELVGQDQAEPMLAIARREAARAGLSLRTMSCAAESLALEDGTADVVTCKQLLHEVPEPHAIAAEALRVLRPRGRLFLVDFDADGSRAAAAAVRALLLVTRGRQIARDFWRSFRAGLPGADVGAMVAGVGFEQVEYHRAGFDYFVTARKPPK